MTKVFGDLFSVKQSDKNALDKLAGRRVAPRRVISSELARSSARLAARLGRQIGLLIERKGEVEQVVLGTKSRLYLPDLGRYRLSSGRLRRLRLVVFMPPQSFDTAKVAQEQMHLPSKHYPLNQPTGMPEDKCFHCPIIPRDLITDLEKLRLDGVMVCATDDNGDPGAFTLVVLEPAGDKYHPLLKATPGRHQQFISVYHFRTAYDVPLDFEAVVEDIERRLSVTAERTHKTGKDRAIIVGAYTGNGEDIRYAIDELQELARTAGVTVLDTVVQKRRELDPKTIIGKGKIEELALHALELEADLLIFDRELTPAQLRNITKVTELRVIDRSMLILDIFAQRAKTSEGRVQVELAQLKYSLPRLTEKDSGLSRLTGGIGGRGPGETKLEIGRRRIRDRIADLEKKIDSLSIQRCLRRSRRQERGVPVVGIVGYTNAGKSTLLNALTKGHALVEDKMFATLDPASRRMRFPNEREVVFVDTVGFIRELPEELLAAFCATLEEVGESDLLLHLVDGSSPDAPKQVQVVKDTLSSLGFADKPRLLVLSKTDLLGSWESEIVRRNFPDAVLVSALTRLGLDRLVEIIQTKLGEFFSGQDPGGFLFRDFTANED